MRYQAHNLLEEALEWAFLLSVAILSGPSGSGQAYPSKCCRQTCLLLWIQFWTEVYSLLSLGHFIHCGCYLVTIWLIIGCYLYQVFLFWYKCSGAVQCTGAAQCTGPVRVNIFFWYI